MPATTSPAHTNRLIHETSPYLLQHAHNPVDWFPWGAEAFAEAKRRGVPIFLSVGYSTCYWCHVMERQCFEVEAIAEVMNDRFVSIKVDREERPDVDSLYMTAVQLLTQGGGWPMSVFLTPDGRPFYGGTYFSPTDAPGRPGFPRVLNAMADAYQDRRTEVEKNADQLTAVLKRLATPPRPEARLAVDKALVASMVQRSMAEFDLNNGGFGTAPKFPQETLLQLLLDADVDAESRKSINTRLKLTLDAMANGGIRDQLGGGFHRYSTDAHWLVPHFEIMLYDQAMLGRVYAEASAALKEPRYAGVARGVFDFVLREMTAPAGGFYTAFDAEVDSQEGQNYLWTPAQVEAVLGKADAARLGKLYGLDQGPNFADPHHGDGSPDANILHLPDGPAGTDEPAVVAMRQTLLAARMTRKQPLLDTKIITSWNALTIHGLASAGKLLGEKRYLDAAEKAATFLLEKHRDAGGMIRRTSRDGTVSDHPGFLDDYAFLADALLALHAATGAERWKREAAAVAKQMNGRFADLAGGAFYFTDKNANDLIVRQKTASDSPLPSGNAVAAMVELSLGNPGVTQAVLRDFAATMDDHPSGASSMVEAAGAYLSKHGEFAVEPSPQTDRPESPQDRAAKTVQVRGEWADPTHLKIVLHVADGYHINAHGTKEPLIGTDLSTAGAHAADQASVDYPTGKPLNVGGVAADVYAGEVPITVTFKKPQAEAVELSLTFQACTDAACLPPVTGTFSVRPFKKP